MSIFKAIFKSSILWCALPFLPIAISSRILDRGKRDNYKIESPGADRKYWGSFSVLNWSPNQLGKKRAEY